jgi:hypothetical protein
MYFYKCSLEVQQAECVLVCHTLHIDVSNSDLQHIFRLETLINMLLSAVRNT